MHLSTDLYMVMAYGCEGELPEAGGGESCLFGLAAGEVSKPKTEVRLGNEDVECPVLFITRVLLGQRRRFQSSIKV